MAAPEKAPEEGIKRDAELMAVEEQIRQAVRDAVNRPSRKPFHWGGLAGYRQLQALGEALNRVSKDDHDPEADYLRRVAGQVNRAVENNRRAAEDVAAAQDWLRRIAACLRYPPRPAHASDATCASDMKETRSPVAPLTSAQVCSEMEELLQEFQPCLKWQPAQAALYHTWHRLWDTGRRCCTVTTFPVCRRTI